MDAGQLLPWGPQYRADHGVLVATRQRGFEAEREYELWIPEIPLGMLDDSIRCDQHQDKQRHRLLAVLRHHCCPNMATTPPSYMILLDATATTTTTTYYSHDYYY